MQSIGCFANAFALKAFNGIKLCGYLLWSEASMLHKDIYICCMENCGILNVAVILYARMWIEIIDKDTYNYVKVVSSSVRGCGLKFFQHHTAYLQVVPSSV